MKEYLFDQAFYSGEDGDAAQHARIVKRETVADKTTRRCAYTHAFGHDFSSLRGLPYSRNTAIRAPAAPDIRSRILT
jgi:hypothetical protein